MSLRIDPAHIWNVIYNARSNQRQPPPSQNTAPATQNASHDWSASHMKRHLQWAEQVKSPFKLTKYCACHAKWISSFIGLTYETSFTRRGTTSVILQLHQCHEKWVSGLIRLTYETSCTKRGATALTLQPQQILPLPREMNLMIFLAHIWNVIYNAGSNRTHTPTSPNTAPAKQDDTHDWSCSQMKRHDNARINSTHPPTSPNIAPATQNDMPKYEENVLKTVEASFTMRGRFDHDPSVIRAWNCKTEPARSASLLFPPINAFCIENYNMSRSGYLSKFHQILRRRQKVTVQDHQMLRLPRKVTLRHHQILRLPRKETLQHRQMLCLQRAVTLRRHQIVCLPRSWTVTVLNCCFTELLLYWAVTLLIIAACPSPLQEGLLGWGGKNTGTK